MWTEWTIADARLVEGMLRVLRWVLSVLERFLSDATGDPPGLAAIRSLL